MKKQMRILSVIVAILLIATSGAISASAALPPVTMGDIDHNGLDITDATAVQRTVAQLDELDELQSFAADVDNDEKVTIIDATLIQQHLAGMINEFPAGNYRYLDLYAEALVSDYSSGNARVGTPVTFTAIASGDASPLMYKFYINDELVQDYSTSNTFVHTFEQPGTYTVEYYVKSRAGLESSEHIDLTVTEAMDIGYINITSIYHKGFYDYYLNFEAIAECGTEPYEYAFALYDQTYTTSDDQFGILVEKQDYSESNTFTLTKALEDYNEYTLYVIVRDSQGNNDIDTLSFRYMTPPPA